MRAAQQSTNEYHKAQYVSAFIEAHSAALMHRSVVEGMHRNILLPETRSNTELTNLARELEQKYDSGTIAAASPSSSPASVGLAVVPFGAWRHTPYPIQKAERSNHVVQHCILREARTPAEWSPQYLERQLPHREPSWQTLHAFLEGLGRRTHEEIDAAKVYRRYQRYLRESRRGMAFGGNSTTARRVCTSYVAQYLVNVVGWECSYAFLKCYLQEPHMASADNRAAEASQLLGVFAEAVRYLDLEPTALPSLKHIEELLVLATQYASVEHPETEGAAAAVVLQPAAAAPLLSIVAERSDSAVEALQRIAHRYLIHVCPQSKRLYLPPVAWGELLAALYRCGASLTLVQSVTDDITDAARTHHAEKLLRHPLVWKGYLSGCDVSHALAVYDSNRPFYGLKEVPALAAVLIRMLVREGSSVSLCRAEDVWKRMTARAGGMIIGTSSVLAARVGLFAAQKNLQGLLRFAFDYDSFFVYFGVERAQWEDAVARHASWRPHSLHQLNAGELAGLFQFILQEMDACGSDIPPIVRHAWEAVTEKCASADKVPEISPDLLADLL